MKCLSLFFYFCFVHKIGKEVNVLFFFTFCFEKRTNDKRIPFPLRGDWGGGAFSERHGYPGYTLGVTCMQTRGEPETVVLDLQEP